MRISTHTHTHTSKKVGSSAAAREELGRKRCAAHDSCTCACSCCACISLGSELLLFPLKLLPRPQVERESRERRVGCKGAGSAKQSRGTQHLCTAHARWRSAGEDGSTRTRTPTLACRVIYHKYVEHTNILARWQVYRRILQPRKYTISGSHTTADTCMTSTCKMNDLCTSLEKTPSSNSDFASRSPCR
jgi:hypothetical protein